MEREHPRVHEENKTEAGKVWWVRWVRWDRPDDVGGLVGRRWGWPDEDGDGRMKMGMAGRRWGWPDEDGDGRTKMGMAGRRWGRTLTEAGNRRQPMLCMS